MTFKARLNSILINSLLVGGSFLIPIIFFDLVFKSLNLPKNNARLAFLSNKGTSTNLKTGIRTYIPNTNYRHIVMYGDEVGFDLSFETDKYGYRKTYSCEGNEKSKVNFPKGLLAVSGDSFTEANGSNISWVSAVQEIACKSGWDSVNTSMGGYGLREMSNALIHSYNELDADLAIVSFIVEDISRPQRYVHKNETCSVFMDKELNHRCGQLPTWWHIPYDSSKEFIKEFAQQKKKTGLLPVIKTEIPKLSNISISILSKFKKELINIFPYKNRNLISIEKNIEIENIESISIIKDSANAAKEIVDKYGVKKTAFLIIPTKWDALKGKDHNDRLSIEKKQLELFQSEIDKRISLIDLRSCELNPTDFIKLDGHPNESGHKKIANCAIKNSLFREFILNIK